MNFDILLYFQLFNVDTKVVVVVVVIIITMLQKSTEMDTTSPSSTWDSPGGTS